MTLTAEGHVHVLSANHHVAVLAGCSERIAGVLLAELADGGQLLDLLTFGNQLQYAWEGTTHEGSLQT